MIGVVGGASDTIVKKINKNLYCIIEFFTECYKGSELK